MAIAYPTKSSVFMLKHPVRYLHGVLRLVWRFNFQPRSYLLTTAVGADFAGCVTTRRSTSGSLTQRCSQLTRHWSDTQTTAALSSVEAELSGICHGASTSLEQASIAKDRGMNFKTLINTDATAPIGICRRQGLGKNSTWRRQIFGCKTGSVPEFP